MEKVRSNNVISFVRTFQVDLFKYLEYKTLRKGRSKKSLNKIYFQLVVSNMTKKLNSITKIFYIILLGIIFFANCGGGGSGGLNPLALLLLSGSGSNTPSTGSSGTNTSGTGNNSSSSNSGTGGSNSTSLPPAPTVTASSYTWTQTTGTYTPLSGGTVILANSSNQSQILPAPFNISYRGGQFNQIEISTNGYIRLTAVTNPSTSVTSSNTSSASFFYSSFSLLTNSIGPWVFPQNDDVTSTIQYTTTGTSPNRVFTVDWAQMRPSTMSNSNIRFNYQVRIFENGIIEFAYGPRTFTQTGTVSASNGGGIAIRGELNTDFIEGKTGSKVTTNSTYRFGDFPVNGTVYRFNPTSGTPSTISDPLLSYQWHLINSGQLGGTSGEDARVNSVWTAGNFGEGVRVGVVDDGQAILHEDLSANVVSGAGYNYVNLSTDPSGSSANHGTCVSGIIAARDNAVGGRGAAPRASLIGYNLLLNLNATNSADSMTRGTLDISNNSWGATDGTGFYDNSLAPASWTTAITNGITSGRSNRGINYYWAGGNGGDRDNSNYDAQANFYGVTAVAAIGDDGVRASYSEQGANLWISAHSQGNNSKRITTTDNISTNGYNTSSSTFGTNYANIDYTNTFNGTSSATPLVAGVAALILRANSNLTWRDVRLILAETARQNDPTDSGWVTGAAKLSSGNYRFNHKYGFGAVNAADAVTLASSWTSVGGTGSLVTCTSTLRSPGTAIPDNNLASAISDTNTVSTCSGVGKIEYVAIQMNSNHTYVGDLQITLTSPTGAVSNLSDVHVCVSASTGNSVNCGTFPSNTWRFGSARHLGEAANGNWTIRVGDGGLADNGNLTSWQLTFYGRN